MVKIYFSLFVWDTHGCIQFEGNNMYNYFFLNDSEKDSV